MSADCLGEKKVIASHEGLSGVYYPGAVFNTDVIHLCLCCCCAGLHAGWDSATGQEGGDFHKSSLWVSPVTGIDCSKSQRQRATASLLLRPSF